MNIFIVTGRSRFVGNFYDTLINIIKGYFYDKNIKFETIHFADQVRKDENNDNLYIGIFHHVDLHNMPKNYIMLAMDPPSNCNDIMKQKLKNANKILVYTDLEYFKNVNKNIIFYPFPYHNSIENMYNLDINKISKKIDLLTIGCMNDKRIKLIEILKNKNYNIYCPNIRDFPQGIYEKNHDILLHSSKIVLLKNYYKNDIDYPRMIYNAANKIFFIYILNEDDDENLLNDVYNNLIVTCNSNNMFEIVDYYLENEDIRIEKANILYDYVKNNLCVNNYLNIF
jgi:hypothetical protein